MNLRRVVLDLLCAPAKAQRIAGHMRFSGCWRALAKGTAWAFFLIDCAIRHHRQVAAEGYSGPQVPRPGRESEKKTEREREKGREEKWCPEFRFPFRRALLWLSFAVCCMWQNCHLLTGGHFMGGKCSCLGLEAALAALSDGVGYSSPGGRPPKGTPPWHCMFQSNNCKRSRCCHRCAEVLDEDSPAVRGYKSNASKNNVRYHKNSEGHTRPPAGDW